MLREQRARDQDGRLNLASRDVCLDCLNCLPADLGRILDHIGVYLSGFDRCTRFRHGIKTDNFHLTRLAGFFDRGESAQRGIVIDPEDGIHLGMCLKNVLSRPKGLIFNPVARQLRYYLYARCFGQLLLESLDALDDRFDLGMVDYRHLSQAVQYLHHGLSRQPSARDIVRRDMRDNRGAFSQAGDIGGKNRDAGIVGRLDGCPDRSGITRREDNRIYLSDDKILDPDLSVWQRRIPRP